jgi:hypothetical protein
MDTAAESAPSHLHLATMAVARLDSSDEVPNPGLNIYEIWVIAKPIKKAKQQVE